MFYNQKDTICSIATPPGRGGIGVIRVSGPKSLEAIASIFKGKSSLPASLPNTLHHGYIVSGDKIVDEVVVSVFKKPNSYTGENIVEISSHGSPVILNEILSLCKNAGLRQSLPGEFTFRAFINGKIDLSRAEAVCDTIQSKTELSLAANVAKLTGNLHNRVSAWKENLIDTIANMEASLDHPDEDLGTRHTSETNLLKLLNDITAITVSSSKYRLLKEGVKISIIGKPNTGKSSLFNAFLERDKAIVTEHAGTTRDVVEDVLDIRGVPVIMSDTAGLRVDFDNPVEKIGQEKTLKQIKDADLVFFVLDSSKLLDKDDFYTADNLKSVGQNNIVFLLNKSDLPSMLDISSFPGIHPLKIFNVSALNNTGLKDVEEFIYSWFLHSGPDKENNLLLNSRQNEVFQRVGLSIEQALLSLTKNETEEIIAFHLREALAGLGEITGETVSEEILQKIFSNFCVGK